MTCCFCTPTAQYIEDNGWDDYAAGTDIFDEILGDMDSANVSTYEDWLWYAYRLQMIGGCDLEEWVRAMKDRAAVAVPKWDDILATLASVDLASLDAAAFTRILDHTAVPGTQGTVRTTSHTGDDVTVIGSETLPQSVPSGTYLDGKTTNTRTNGQTDTDNTVPNERQTETYSAQQDLNAETVRAMVLAYPELPMMFAREFSAFFVQRW